MKVFLVLLLAAVCGLATCEVFYEEKFQDGELIEIFPTCATSVEYFPNRPFLCDPLSGMAI